MLMSRHMSRLSRYNFICLSDQLGSVDMLVIPLGSWFAFLLTILVL